MIGHLGHHLIGFMASPHDGVDVGDIQQQAVEPESGTGFGACDAPWKRRHSRPGQAECEHADGTPRHGLLVDGRGGRWKCIARKGLGVRAGGRARLLDSGGVVVHLVRRGVQAVTGMRKPILTRSLVASRDQLRIGSPTSGCRPGVFAASIAAAAP